MVKELSHSDFQVSSRTSSKKFPLEVRYVIKITLIIKVLMKFCLFKRIKRTYLAINAICTTTRFKDHSFVSTYFLKVLNKMRKSENLRI